MNQDVWCLLADISSLWRLDTQEIEGVNSLIKKMTGDSPNMNLELLSARVTIKKTMSAKLTTHEERQQGADACIEHHAAAKEFVTDESRWTEPTGNDYVLPEIIHPPKARITKHEKCIAKMFAKFKEVNQVGKNLQPSSEIALCLDCSSDKEMDKFCVVACALYAKRWG